MASTLTVADMACTGCEETIEEAVGAVDGVTAVEADHERGTVSIEGEGDLEAVRTAIHDAGYEVEA